MFGKDPDLIARLVDPLRTRSAASTSTASASEAPTCSPSSGARIRPRHAVGAHDALRSFSIRTMVAAKQTEATRKLLDEIVLGNKSNFLNTRFIL